MGILDKILKNKKEAILPIEKIEIGDIIRIRNQKIIPCDTELLNTESILTSKALIM